MQPPSTHPELRNEMTCEGVWFKVWCEEGLRGEGINGCKGWEGVKVREETEWRPGVEKGWRGGARVEAEEGRTRMERQGKREGKRVGKRAGGREGEGKREGCREGEGEGRRKSRREGGLSRHAWGEGADIWHCRDGRSSMGDKNRN